MSEVLVSVEAVKVVGRHRKDLGDISGLARSIADIGLINPITLAEDMTLIAGERRLAAVRSIGWTEIPARIVSTLDDAAARLRAERDENTERKEMTISERVALGQALEELERPRAAERKLAGLRQNRSGDFTGTVGAKAETREVVGSAIGMAGSQYTHAKMVVASANDPDLPPEIREVARAAQVEMDQTGQVNRAYQQVKRARDGEAPLPPKTNNRKRRPLVDAAKDAGWAIRKDVEKIQRIFTDDRYPQNKEQVTAHLHGHLTYTLQVCQDLINQLEGKAYQ